MPTLIEIANIEPILDSLPDQSTVEVVRPEVKKINREVREMTFISVIKDLKAIIQPRSDSLMATILGRVSETTNIMFCKFCDIQSNDEVICGQDRYLVLSMKPYGEHHLEVSLKDKKNV